MSWREASSSSGSRASRPTTARATTSRQTRSSPTDAPAPRRPGSTAASIARRPRRRWTRSIGEGRGVVFGRSGWTGQQATGMLWGGDQASDFWSLRALLTSLLTCAASGFSNLSHDVGGYLGRRLAERCEPELLIRWAQLGALSAADAGARALRAGGLDLRRDAFSTSTARRSCFTSGSSPTSAPPRPPPPAPACRSCARSAWSTPRIPTAGRSPTPTCSGRRSGSRRCSSEGATERHTYLPRGEWLDWWTGERHRGRSLDRRRGPTRAHPALGPLRLPHGHLPG